MSAIDPATYTTFENSLFRCAASETFLERFYDIFLKKIGRASCRERV